MLNYAKRNTSRYFFFFSSKRSTDYQQRNHNILKAYPRLILCFVILQEDISHLCLHYSTPNCKSFHLYHIKYYPTAPNPFSGIGIIAGDTTTIMGLTTNQRTYLLPIIQCVVCVVPREWTLKGLKIWVGQTLGFRSLCNRSVTRRTNRDWPIRHVIRGWPPTHNQGPSQ